MIDSHCHRDKQREIEGGERERDEIDRDRQTDTYIEQAQVLVVLLLSEAV